jgi:hypothetical protein
MGNSQSNQVELIDNIEKDIKKLENQLNDDSTNNSTGFTDMSMSMSMSSTGFTDKSETGYTDKSKTGYTDKSKTGYTDKSETGYTDKSETGYTDKSETGYTDKSETRYTKSKKPIKMVYVSVSSYRKSNKDNKYDIHSEKFSYIKDKPIRYEIIVNHMNKEKLRKIIKKVIKIYKNTEKEHLNDIIFKQIKEATDYLNIELKDIDLEFQGHTKKEKLKQLEKIYDIIV